MGRLAAYAAMVASALMLSACTTWVRIEPRGLALTPDHPTTFTRFNGEICEACIEMQVNAVQRNGADGWVKVTLATNRDLEALARSHQYYSVRYSMFECDVGDDLENPAVHSGHLFPAGRDGKRFLYDAYIPAAYSRLFKLNRPWGWNPERLAEGGHCLRLNGGNMALMRVRSNIVRIDGYAGLAKKE